jgi:hypothetical protein
MGSHFLSTIRVASFKRIFINLNPCLSGRFFLCDCWLNGGKRGAKPVVYFNAAQRTVQVNSIGMTRNDKQKKCAHQAHSLEIFQAVYGLKIDSKIGRK